MPQKNSAEPTKFVVSVDTVVFGYSQKSLWVPLMQRARAPFTDAWSLPGGVVHDNEAADEACHRVLEDNIGLKLEHLEQLYTFNNPKRDPRGRTISIAHWALVANDNTPLKWGPGAKTAKWFKLDELPQGPWAFDHEQILDMAVARLKAKVGYEPIGLKLLPEEFSLSELQALYEAVLGRKIERRNFYPKIQKTGLVEFVRERKSERGKPAKLYRFHHAKYAKLKENGMAFEIL